MQRRTAGALKAAVVEFKGFQAFTACLVYDLGVVENRDYWYNKL
jgi:hypothetical protein